MIDIIQEALMVFAKHDIYVAAITLSDADFYVLNMEIRDKLKGTMQTELVKLYGPGGYINIYPENKDVK